MTEDRRGVGARVAERRKLNGLTQPQLADRSNLSASLVRQVEQGRVPATPAFLAAVSKALHCSVADLTGQPYPPAAGRDTEAYTAIGAVRAELAAYDLDPDETVTTIRPLAEIELDVADIGRARRNASFQKLGAQLPTLLPEVRAAVHRSTGVERDRAFVMLCELYYSSHSLAHKLGFADLATIAIERMAWAANESGHQVWMAASQFQRAAILTSGGNWNAALKYLESCRASIESRLVAGHRGDLVSWGGLHLQSGLAAARSGRRSLADAHLAEARESANRLGADGLDPILTFGPTNVGIWSVALAVEGLDAIEALNRASALVIPADMPKERVGMHWIDVSRAYLLNGDRTSAFDALAAARTIAPAQTRYNPMVHETIRALARAEARRTDTVAGFAAWCGITRAV
ncbi:XRE family transcriptional regulator [Nocardia panacis]|uniref:XRE family transcriptional regulator n=1 Tax=Nocardia panacis TaxID=2340916 RepID=A0A3A4KU52_9NOCA|nr:helix-turn-helix transcriptional regulator [Nocardia panacis]RJO76966.1 XRE family transcriptional regulator [Nocardia panacis]